MRFLSKGGRKKKILEKEFANEEIQRYINGNKSKLQLNGYKV